MNAAPLAIALFGCAAAAAPPAPRGVRVGRMPIAVAAADLDGDGRSEVAAPDAARDLIRLCRVCPAGATGR